MAKGITRTIVSTEIEVAKFENGELLPLGSIIEDKAVEKEEAVKIANRIYKGEGQIVVTDVKVSEPQRRRISLKDFMKYSEVIDVKEEDETEEVAEHTEQEVSGF